MNEVEPEVQEILGTPIFVRGQNRPLRELTQDDVRDRAAELRSTVGWGPTARVAPIARAWAQLAMVMERGSTRTVAELPQETVLEVGRQLWIRF
jgi:hypothetical protein